MEELTEYQKQEIINEAIKSASEIMKLAAMVCKSDNYIIGEVVFPDNEKWKISFEKITTETGAKR